MVLSLRLEFTGSPLITYSGGEKAAHTITQVLDLCSMMRWTIRWISLPRQLSVVYGSRVYGSGFRPEGHVQLCPLELCSSRVSCFSALLCTTARYMLMLHNGLDALVLSHACADCIYLLTSTTTNLTCAVPLYIQQTEGKIHGGTQPH